MRIAVLAAMVGVVAYSEAANAGVIYASDFAQLSAAIASANASAGEDTIYLSPGEYSGGSLPNILDSLTLALDPASGAPAGAAILNTTPTEEKGILTIPFGVNSVNLTVNGLTFENASISASSGGNGAGIRDQSSGVSSLNILNSRFLNNQTGVLTGNGTNELLDVLISNSLFANNGAADPFQHAIYIYGHSLAVSGSTFCGTNTGHDIKSRAAITSVTNSTLYDGAPDPSNPICQTGSSSYALDLPNGGNVTIQGVNFVQGAATQNRAIVSYGEEGLNFSDNSLLVSDSNFISSVSGTGIQEVAQNGVPTCFAPVQLSNTTFSPTLVPVSPPNCVAEAPTPVPVDEPSTWWMLMSVAALAACWKASPLRKALAKRRAAALS